MMKLTRLLGATALAGTLLAVPSVAWAQDDTAATIESTTAVQDEEADDSASGGEEEVLVTGSRIRRQPGLDSSVPITSVGPSEIIQRGDISLGDKLNQLPMLRTTFSQANSTAFIGTAGINQLDLRGQGPSRTLVLVNGRRHVSAIPGQYIVDVNTIPDELVERIDIVSGGNSAVYGSDAIAGVVNFVLKRNYEGVSMRAQGGISTYGDRGSYSIGAIVGHNFMDGALNVTVHGEYAKADALFYKDRSYLGSDNSNGNGGPPGFYTSQITTAPNRNFDGVPNTSFIPGNPGPTFGNASLGGYILPTCPAATATNAAQVALVCTGALTPTGGRIAYGFAFQPNGTLVRDDPTVGLRDNRPLGGGVFGGLSATGIEDAMLLPGLDRLNANLLISGDISSAFQPYLEAKYVRVTATQQSTQPTFLSGGPLINTFRLDNPFLSAQARAQAATIIGNNNDASTFNMVRFNNDLGTRAEDHIRQTYRVVAGVTGDISETANLRYEVAFNYGRTETYYETAYEGRAGNVHVARMNNALQAVRNGAGQIVCAINADATTANDDPACVPFNPFGYNNSSAAAKAYVTYVSERNQWAEQINAVAYISGDSTGLFELPGGPVGFAIGGEYRREDAYSAYDTPTATGATFLNGGAAFEPPAVAIKEAFGELRIPLVKDVPFFQELSVEGAARYSDYGGRTGGVWAWNAGAIWAPITDLRIRGSYARSVRAPNLLNLYQTPADTFSAAAWTDPCDMPGAPNNNTNNNRSSNPNRAANCAAAGIPTTLTYVDGAGTTVTVPWYNQGGSSLLGTLQGNPLLNEEVGTSWTLGAVFQPRWVPGLSISVDYYSIEIENIIASLAGQNVINQCYDDPGGITNPYCASVFRRSTPGNVITNFTFNGQNSRRLQNRVEDTLSPPLPRTSSFLQQPFNFVSQITSGIDADIQYRTKVTDSITLNLRALVSWVEAREQFTSVSVPTQSTRILSTLGDPEWQGAFSADLDFGSFDLSYNARYVGRQLTLGTTWETEFPWQGRPATNPDIRPFDYYKPIVYHGVRVGLKATDDFRFYMGIDNVSNELPPYDVVGVENPSATGQSGAVYPNTGRFFYAGATVKF
jgi:outer membrane receptor protein involved in Fe transport